MTTSSLSLRKLGIAIVGTTTLHPNEKFVVLEAHCCHHGGLALILLPLSDITKTIAVPAHTFTMKHLARGSHEAAIKAVSTAVHVFEDDLLLLRIFTRLGLFDAGTIENMKEDSAFGDKALAPAVYRFLATLVRIENARTADTDACLVTPSSSSAKTPNLGE